MVWEYGLHTIVMLTQCVEAGKVYTVNRHVSTLHKQELSIFSDQVCSVLARKAT